MRLSAFASSVALLAPLVLLAASPAAVAQDDSRAGKDELFALLASTEAGERARAYRLIGPGGANADMASVATRHLSKLLRTDIEAYETAESALLDLGPILSSTTAGRSLQKNVDKWEAARDKAVAAVSDETAWPSPGPTKPVGGPQKGAQKVTRELERAAKAFAKLDDPVREARGKLGTAEEQRARLDDLAARRLVIDERRERIEPLGGTAPKFEPAPLLMFELAQLLAEGKLAEAIELRGDLQGPDRVLFFCLYGQAMNEANEAADGAELDPGCHQAIERLNRLRMALGLLPYEVSKVLTDSLRGHLDEMREKRYFSHYSPDPARRTSQERARLLGWKSSTGENLSDAPPVKSIEIWLWDGGHGRIMFHPTFTWVGLSWNGAFSGMVIGGNESDANRIPRPDLLD